MGRRIEWCHDATDPLAIGRLAAIGATPAPVMAEREAAAELRFEVAIDLPDLTPWRAGDAGLAGFCTRASDRPGPHVGVIALMHGNEIAGAVALDRLLRSGFAPLIGTLTCGFANLAAFDQFDPANPTATRFLDEDMNRLWDPAVLGGNRTSRELDRARVLAPVIETLDIVLDLHTMLWPSEPLLLCGPSPRGRALAASIGVPELIVADSGHLSGRRLIDCPRFTEPDGRAAAVLLESGLHWQPDSVALAEAAIAGLLQTTGLADAAFPTTRLAPRFAPRFAEVTQAITATTAHFEFVRPYRGGDIVRRADTLIAMDGAQEIRTPHDDCLLIMPSLRPSRGHTAVRLARTS